MSNEVHKMNKESLVYFELLNNENSVVVNRYLMHAIGDRETIIYQSLIAKYMYYYDNNMLDEEGYYYCTADDLEESTSLSRRIQDNAITKLKELNLIDVVVKGLPAKRYFKITFDIEVISTLIEKGKIRCSELKSKKQSNNSFNKMSKLDSEKQSNTSFDKMSKLDSTKCENKIRQNVEENISIINISNKNNNISVSQSNNYIDNYIESPLIGNRQTDRLTDISSFDNKKLELPSLKYNKKTTKASLLKPVIKENKTVKSNTDNDYKQVDDYFERQLGLDELRKAFEPEIIDEIKLNILEMYYNDFTLIHGQKKPKEIVRSVLTKLTYWHIEAVIIKYINIDCKITNVKAYLQTMLYNIVYEKDLNTKNQINQIH